MNSLKFERSQLKHLSYLLKLPTELLIEVLADPNSYYYQREIEKTDAKTGDPKTYSDGTNKIRRLNPSTGDLKLVQKRIKEKVFKSYSFPEHIQGGISGRSNVTNAKYHQGNKFIFSTDLMDFFPTINPCLVMNAFLGMGYSYGVSKLLTRLTTYNFVLPQGAPTSSYVANLCGLSMDEQLLNICRSSAIRYTRYIDDLTFSSPHDFSEVIADILNAIRCTYKVNYRKTVYSIDGAVTGIVLRNSGIFATKEQKNRAIDEQWNGKECKAMTRYVNYVEQENKKGGRRRVLAGISA